MSNKNAISVLQELMAARKKQLPRYVEQGVINGEFVCCVFTDDIQAVGQGMTKKAAKLQSAEKALASLISTSKQAIEEKHVIKENKQPLTTEVMRCKSENYVGILNEKAAQKGFHYPIYEFITIMQGEFVMSCNFLGQNEEGKGTTKKLAKKNAAAKMLNKLKSIDFSQYSAYKIAPIISNPDILDYNGVLEKYSILSLGPGEKNDIISRTETIPKLCRELPEEEEKEVYSLEHYQKKIQSLGIDYTVLEVQSNSPCMFGIKIYPSSHCFLGNGLNREEALKDAFKSVFAGFRDGLNFYKKMV